ncbi:hypothetical protein HELRODRAFT_185918 [Helobdella robusta]|uniref:Mitochondrial import receptor subunit TOM40 homolog n=1 Tax=Helobdella robusta TaxID=6412 RepID=T1FNF8_HELRO|nr:hypothetical protein HELRODRAFT_185918 [Helobdella robusta]ESN97187.1 hypothetical protein HELRODRAFT_185918 [Helobdella robusta]
MASVPPPSTEIPKVVSPPGDAKSETGLAVPAQDDTNPGVYDDLHRKCKEVFPAPFEGARLQINKGLSSVFQISHTLTMSSLQPSGYRFGCTYVGDRQFGPNEAYPVLLGDMDFSGSLNAQVIHQFTKAIRCRFISQIQCSKLVGSQMGLEYRGKDYTTSFTLANVDLRKDSGMFICNYLQNITKRIALGTEFLYQSDANIPGGHVGAVSFGARYSGDSWQISSNLTPFTLGMKLCYYQKASNTMQFGVELDGNLASQECTTTVAYQVDLPKSDVVFKGQLDSNFCIGAVLEKKLLPMPFTLTLSGFGNHVKNTFRFGIGFTVGS